MCLSSQAKEKSVFGQTKFRLKRGVRLSFQAEERNVSFQAKEKTEFVTPGYREEYVCHCRLKREGCVCHFRLKRGVCLSLRRVLQYP